MLIAFQSVSRQVDGVTSDGRAMTFEIEYRWDPLTGRVSVIAPHLKADWFPLFAAGAAEQGRGGPEVAEMACPFCPPAIDATVEAFQPRQQGADIRRAGDVCAFRRFSPAVLFGARLLLPGVHRAFPCVSGDAFLFPLLRGAVDLIREMYQENGEMAYAAIGADYGASAGAHRPHFHLSVSMQECPFDHVRILMDCSRRYEKERQADFWTDLLMSNRPREISAPGNFYWYTPFAPTAQAEVCALVNRASLAELTTPDLREMARGLSNVLRYYESRHFAAFNLAIYSGPLDSCNAGFPVGLRLVARPMPRGEHISVDSSHVPFLLGQASVMETPEFLAGEIRKYF